MKLAIRLVFLAQLALSAACATGPRPGLTTSLAQKMVEEASREAPPQDDGEGAALSVLRDRHVLFVGGFLNELIPGYFDDNAEVARGLGATTSLIFPSSGTAIEDDAEQVRDEVLARHAQTGRPVILVGHSKGGAAALLSALRFPELVLTGVVDRVVVIQGAIGGSPLAGAIAGSAPVKVLPVRWRGLESLTAAEARPLFRRELAAARAKLTADGQERLFARIYYVRAWERRWGTSFELALTHAYLRGFGSGQNDGLLLQEDQKLEGAGIDLGAVASDHASLTVAGALSNSTARDRKAFTRALFREIYEPASAARGAGRASAIALRD